jgi:hypothetical protein
MDRMVLYETEMPRHLPGHFCLCNLLLQLVEFFCTVQFFQHNAKTAANLLFAERLLTAFAMP